MTHPDRAPRWLVASFATLWFITGSFTANLLAADVGGEFGRFPQGLRRLAGLPARPGETAIPARAISIVDLAAPEVAGAAGRVTTQGHTRYLSLPADTEWSTPLRPLKPGANYVTFTALLSLGSVVSVDSAYVSLAKSEHAGYATVMVGYRQGEDIVWLSLMHDVRLHSYSGQLMGSLNMVTICTDTELSRWSILTVDQLAGYDLPLGPVEPGPRRFAVTTGPGGAAVCGLACAEEHPVYEDANANGIRDSFETKLLGAPLKRDASRETRDRLVHAWKIRRELQPSDFVLPVKTQGKDVDPDLTPAHYFSDLPASDPQPPREGGEIRGIPNSYLGPIKDMPPSLRPLPKSTK